MFIVGTVSIINLKTFLLQLPFNLEFWILSILYRLSLNTLTATLYYSTLLHKKAGFHW